MLHDIGRVGWQWSSGTVLDLSLTVCQHDDLLQATLNIYEHTEVCCVGTYPLYGKGDELPILSMLLTYCMLRPTCLLPSSVRKLNLAVWAMG